MESNNFAALSPLPLFTIHQNENNNLYFAKISPRDFNVFALLFSLYLFLHYVKKISDFAKAFILQALYLVIRRGSCQREDHPMLSSTCGIV